MPRRTRSIRTDILAAVAGQPIAIYAPVLSAFLDGGETYDDVAAAMSGAAGGLGLAAPGDADPPGDAADRAAVHPATARAVARRHGAVTVIPVKGVISHRANSMEAVGVGVSTETLSRQFRAAVSDADTKAIVLDIESPGGTVPGVDTLADEIFAARGDKPIVAQVNGMCASAAYWIAASAEEIAAPPASHTGSIGVFTMHMDATAALEMEGLKVTPITSSPDKIEELSIVSLSDEAREYLQGRVDHVDNMFTSAVARGRGMRPGDVRGMDGRGRVWAGQQALERGLIDRVRSMTDTLAAFGVDITAPAEPQRGRGSAKARMAREIDLLDS